MSVLTAPEIAAFSGPAEHLVAELERIELLLRRRALLLHDTGLIIDSDFRGRYVAGKHIDRAPFDGQQAPEPPAAVALARLAAQVDELNRQRTALADEMGAELRLPRLARLAGLGRLEVDALLLAAGAQLDLCWEGLLAYVQDDVTRRRPTLQLALDLLTHDRDERLHGRALLSAGPLIRDRLMRLIGEFDEHSRPPLPARSLGLEERVLRHLLGDDSVDDALGGSVERLAAADLDLSGEHAAAAAALEAHVPVILQGRPAAGGRDVAAALAARLGRSALAVDLRGVPGEPAAIAAAVRREARLADAAVYLEAADELWPELLLDLLGWFPVARLPLIVRARGPLADPHPHRRLALHLPWLAIAARRDRWTRAAADAGVALSPAVVDELAAKLSLDEAQTAAVLDDARRRAGGDTVAVGHLDAAARAAAGGALGELAHRLEPRYRLDDVILPPRQSSALTELCARVRNRPVVHERWGFPAPTRGDGVTVLFHGASGTGKTMAAEALARELGLELYRVDLATVVSKYIGETEKNLRRVFAAAATVNGILLFDEADALFGRRSEVRDAHDRYANIETAYLLGEFESFSGLTVLATNLIANVDDAFTRRIQLSIEFPMPGAAERERMWRRALPPSAPLAGDVDLRSMAQRVEVSGAVIANAALAAAFAAAADGTPITLAHLVSGAAREVEKLGRPVTRAEFGDLYAALAPRPGAPAARRAAQW